MKRRLIVAAGVLAGLPACAHRNPVEYTSTREVTCLTASADGSLWAGTTGGVLRRSPDGIWRKFTRLDGLPSNEVRAIRIDNKGNPCVDFPTQSAVWDGSCWKRSPTVSGPGQYGEAHAKWNGFDCDGGIDGVSLINAATRISLPLPNGNGTHISALKADGSQLLAAFYGDGLYSTDGRSWTPIESDLPATAREITAIEPCNGDIWIGTRRDGLWQKSKGKWIQHLQPDEPYFHNAESISRFRESILVSTLEDGLQKFESGRWTRVESLSSNAPRQMCEFMGKLYVRHGNGKVDCFDGNAWQADAFHNDLPRKQATALATDSDRLYVAQWGGWSELDPGVHDGGHTAEGHPAEEFIPTESRWVHYLNLDQLQGKQTTCLLPAGNWLWIGTQGGGVYEYNRTTGKLHQHAEPEGLPDDWVTSLARCGNQIYAATFAGGLVRWSGSRWQPVAREIGACVMSLLPNGKDTLFAVARTGIWRIDPTGKATRPFPSVDSEAQSICPTPGGFWLGARTGIYCIPN